MASQPVMSEASELPSAEGSMMDNDRIVEVLRLQCAVRQGRLDVPELRLWDTHITDTDEATCGAWARVVSSCDPCFDLARV